MPNGFLFNLYKRTATSDTITYYFGSVFPNVLNVTNTKLIYTVAGADTETAKAGFDSVPLTADKIPLTSTDKTPVTTALKYRCNPNLLDNWYFANPVDQRKGYIVPAGVAYYKVDGFVPQGPIPETVRVDYIDYADSARFNYGGAACYVPKDGGYVRGYTAAGYTVDRWAIGDGSSGTLSLAENGLKITRTNGIMYLIHSISKTQIPEGSKLTFSVLTTLGLSSISFTIKNDTYHEQDASNGISLGWNYTPAEIAAFTLVNNTVNSDVTVRAAKLELGDTQTLAHKEGDKWVLNEIPDFGEQLRRCELYRRVSASGHYFPGAMYDGSNGVFLFPFFGGMRVTPSIEIVLPGTLQDVNGVKHTLSANNYSIESVDRFGAKIILHGLSGIPVGPANICDAKFALSADL